MTSAPRTPAGELPDQGMARIFLRPIANPLPLGFVGLAGASMMLSGMQLGWVPISEAAQVGIAIIVIAVPLQLIACVMGFLARDPAAATGMGTQAVSWLTIGILTLLPGTRSAALGYVLFYLAAAVLASALMAMMGKAVVGLVLAVTAARFTITGIYQYFGGNGWMYVTGWLGIALAGLAVYAVVALELEGVLHRTVLPTLRAGMGRRALSGEGTSTIGPAEKDPGVRAQL